MSEDKSRLSSWASLLSAMGGLLGKIVWFMVVLVIVTALGRYLYQSGSFGEHGSSRPSLPAVTAPMPVPIAWDAVDQALAEAFRKARAAAEEFASAELDRWVGELAVRVDKDFLPWYFNYLEQQWLGLKAIGYWTAEKLLAEQPSVAERITEDIQEEFSKRVLRPQIAQLRIERITNETMTVYVRSLQTEVAAIPDRYAIPRADWDRYLSDIAVLSSESEGNRRVSLTLKTIVASSAAGGVAGGAYLLKSIQGAVAKIGTKISAKGAGKAAAMAAKTGAKVGAKTGGKLLGPIVGIGILVWDIWDHYETQRTERPILRQNLMDYLGEVKTGILQDPETGIMTLIQSIESTMLSSLEKQNRD